MKPQTKKTLTDFASYAWVAGVAAFYMWAYKQDQVEAAEQKASTFDKEHEINQDLRRIVKFQKGSLSAKEQEISLLEEEVAELKIENARLKNRKTTVINVPLKSAKSGKKIGKYLDQYMADHGVKL